MYELNYSDELQHYGVKGMKWGKRKASATTKSSSKRKNSKQKQSTNKQTSKKKTSAKKQTSTANGEKVATAAVKVGSYAARVGLEYKRQQHVRNAIQSFFDKDYDKVVSSMYVAHGYAKAQSWFE